MSPICRHQTTCFSFSFAFIYPVSMPSFSLSFPLSPSHLNRHSDAAHQQQDFSSLIASADYFIVSFQHKTTPSIEFVFALFAAMRDLSSLVSFSFSRCRIRVYSFALFSLVHPFVSYFFLRLFLACPLPSASDSTTPGFPLLCSSSFFFVPVACLLFLFSVASMAASSIGNPLPLRSAVM